MASKPPRTHYDNLQVAQNASDSVIRAAYRALSQRYHPDKYQGDPAEAQRIMKIVNAAYEVLSDPVKRRQHDDWIKMQTHESPGSGERQAADREDAKGPDAADVLAHVAEGVVRLEELTASSLEAVLARLRSGPEACVKVPLESPTRKSFAMVLFSCWFWLLYVFSEDSHWSADTLMLLGGLSMGAALLVGRALYSLLLWHASPLGNHLVVTPLYLMWATGNRLSYWPLWMVKGVRIRQSTQDITGTITHISVDVASGYDFVLHGKRESENFLAALPRFRQQLFEAVQRADAAYCMQADDIERRASAPASGRFAVPALGLAAFGIPVLAGGIVFSICYHLNSFVEPDFGPPPIARQTQNHPAAPAGKAGPFDDLVPDSDGRWLTPAAIDQFLDAKPESGAGGAGQASRRNEGGVGSGKLLTDAEVFGEASRRNEGGFERLGEDGFAGRPAQNPSLNAPALSLPPTGYLDGTAWPMGDAPLKVRTPAGDEHYFVKVEDWQTGAPVQQFFIRAGESFSTRVPLGKLRLKYATGSVWHGPQYLFGQDTEYEQAEKMLSFIRTADGYSGHTVELIKQAHGNLPTSTLRPSQW